MNQLASRLFRRLATLVGGAARPAELAEERKQLEFSIQEKVSQGMTADEARADAELELRARLNARRDIAARTHAGSIGSWMQDLRFAFRVLRKRPTFAFTAILLIALGVGGTTTVFSAVEALLLSPLPVTDPERVVVLEERVDDTPTGGNPARLRDYRERIESFAAVTGQYSERRVLLNHGEPRHINTLRGFGPHLSVVGKTPDAGRAFTPEEEMGRGTPVAMISSELASELYGSPREALGENIQLNDVSFSIVGTLAGPHYPSETQAWVPAPAGLQDAGRGARFMFITARLADGVSREAAQAELDTVCQTLQQQYPATDQGADARLYRPETWLSANGRLPTLAAFGAAGLLLLIACLNIAGLFIARAHGRARESSIRAALGATGLRVGRLFLTEAALLATLGGLAGIWLAYLTIPLMSETLGNQLNFLAQPALTWRTAGAALALTLFTTLAVGIAPALLAMRGARPLALREGGSVSAGPRAAWLRTALVTGQVSLSLAALTVASLLAKSFLALATVPLGFQPSQLVTLNMDLPWDTPSDRLIAQFSDTLTELRAIPGVVSAGWSDRLPLQGGSQSSTVLIRGKELTPDLAAASVGRRAISTGYLETLGAPLLAGEPLARPTVAEGTTDGAPLNVVVNKTFAEQYFGTADPVGQYVSFSGGVGDEDSPPQWLRIAGVVGDLRQDPVERAVTADVFLHFERNYWPLGNFAIRIQGDPGRYAQTIREAVLRVKPDQVVGRIETMDQELASSLAFPKLQRDAAFFLSILALLLAATGLHGLIASDVAQRTREFALRMALGATGPAIVSTALRRVLTITAIGGLVGLVAAIGLGYLLRELLFETAPFDILAIALAVGVFLLTAAIACWFPARRATSIAPMQALRYD